MGCFYVGFGYKRRKNGLLKIGETNAPTPSSRFANLRSTEGSFQGLGYIILKNETKPQRLFIESYVRMKLESEFQFLHHIKNDHYEYDIISKDTKYSQAEMIGNKALELAKEGCEIAKVEYEVGTKNYKRG